MSRYYFDVFDGSSTTRDDEGIELPTLEAALHEARRAAAEMAKEAIFEGSAGPLEVAIRDRAEGQALFRVSWINQSS